MLKIKGILRDLLKCVQVGSLISLALILVSGLISFIASKANLTSILESMRAILFVVGSIGLIVGAVMLLKKRTEKESDYMEEWKKKYERLSYKQTILVISSLMLIYGCVVDLILFKYY